MTEYMKEIGIRVRYLRLIILNNTVLRNENECIRCSGGNQSAERGWIFRKFLLWRFWCADKEGFLRSETSLIQTIGRAARNARASDHYADTMTATP